MSKCEVVNHDEGGQMEMEMWYLFCHKVVSKWQWAGGMYVYKWSFLLPSSIIALLLHTCALWTEGVSQTSKFQIHIDTFNTELAWPFTPYQNERVKIWSNIFRLIAPAVIPAHDGAKSLKKPNQIVTLSFCNGVKKSG